jgi:2,3-dihydroxybenzoate-AMP ligase
MMIAFTRWPEEFAARYRQKGYWQDLPLTNLITRHAENDAVAIIDGDKSYSYREFNRLVDNLAPAARQGLKRGETALVQLGNVAEFYITFFRAAAHRRRAGQRAVQPPAQRAERLRRAD